MIPFSYPTSADEWQNFGLGLTAVAFTVAFALAIGNAALNWKINKTKRAESRQKDEKIALEFKAKDVEIANAKKGTEEARAEAVKANEGLAKSNEEIARLNAETEQAKKQIAVAKADAANATQRTAEISLKVEEEARKRVEAERALLLLQERIQPRRLIEEQSAELERILRVNPKGHIDVTCMYGDAESCALAAQIVSVLRKADWVIDHFESPLGMGPNPAPLEGMLLLIHDNHSPPAHGNALFLALNEVGIATRGIDNNSVPEGGLQLIVGVKPLEQKRRDITEEQKNNFLNIAKKLIRGKIRIIGVSSDSESMEFAARLNALAKEAGWTPSDISNDAVKYGSIGIVLYLKHPTAFIPLTSPLAPSGNFINALNKVGVLSRVKSDPRLKEDEALIIVGSNDAGITQPIK